MKQLKYNNETYEAERIVKTSDSIIGYNGDNEVFSMRGISDFSGFELLDGAEWDMLEQKEDNTEKNITIAMQETARNELSYLQLKQQNQVLGAELAKSELKILEQDKKILALGLQLSAIELTVLAITKGKDVENGVS
jgi:hypothetical protein